jgi:uncharacterized protein YigA (DUF484 family)
VSGQDTTQALLGEGLEDTVVQFLREQPDLLARHPGLVMSLRIPHECGGAVSLIEYQVDALRRECQELRQHLSSLVDNARSNEELSQRLHRLVLTLVDSQGLDELFTALYQGLEEGFSADRVSLRLFADAADGADRGLAELAGRVPDEDLFASLFTGAQPVCGPLDQSCAQFLFGDRRGEVASAALVPLLVGERRGVLAIGSRSARRFQPSMGTLYLRQLAQVLERLIAPRVM